MFLNGFILDPRAEDGVRRGAEKGGRGICLQSDDCGYLVSRSSRCRFDSGHKNPKVSIFVSQVDSGHHHNMVSQFNSGHHHNMVSQFDSGHHHTIM
ncbi:hypothetical protein RRG08_019449 [Elysia crispata]|uniref:Uncharacterized protein n=1 Tax=Elysia crispata TaxID=231223 RepID=A0AAE0YCC8_9GAST|nr:hypothetical protein RRG08_019449 [Elysia crispata]